jgi:preprotein translocase subunit SecA
MLKWLGSLIDSNEKQLQRLQPLVEEINELEAEFEKRSLEELRAKTEEFKARLKAGSSLDDLLPEAFAAVREAAKQTIGQRHFDVQLLGGIVLHQGKIAEMKTGEGKTLAATLPLYLNSLSGEGCHLVTVNDYLARRDALWMGPIYHALGITVAAIHSQTPDNQAPSFVYDPAYESPDKRWNGLRPITRREAYLADITYGTNNEFGFDYLRDNMVIDLSQYVQRALNYAIVDEVDNLLIDEARTPLIISGPAEEAGQIYVAMDAVVSRMKMKVLPHEPVTAEEKDEENTLGAQYDYIAYEKTHNVKETARGQEQLARAFRMKVDELFGERESLTIEEARKRNHILSIFRQSVMAHAWYQRDRNYVIGKDTDERPGIIIVDEFTGRLMHGRRYSEGLHQAIEAKEHLNVRRESMTYATITFQNYFRMYKKLSGMTGTALTEAEEFHKIYGLEVVVIPTNKPMIREDLADRIYKDEKTKFAAVVREIEELHKQKRPILIGTVSIERSEVLSDMLKRKGIPPEVLNAKNHEKEAGIIAQAGRLGAVTVATNMAGRGVDIILGGNPEYPKKRDEKEWQKEHEEVVKLGGLHILGTERHEARRIDNQLRGRAGRQGDPGSSRFYVSLEDDIMKRFGGERIRGVMEMAGMDENTPIENRLVNRAIESAQVRTEGYHFDIRKHLVEFDDVVNKHRELIYAERRKTLSGADLKANILTMVREEIQNIVATYTGDERNDGRNIEGLFSEVGTIMPLPPELNASTLDSLKSKEIEEKLVSQAEALYEQREKEFGDQNMRILERLVMLRIIDSLWVEHLTNMDQMRLEAGWQTLRQVKAVDAYKNEGYQQFQVLLDTIRHDVAHTIYHVGIRQEARLPELRRSGGQARQPVKEPAPSPMARVAGRPNQRPQSPRQVGVGAKKVGRNDPCPCGSGKKYKHCCGR